MAIRISRTETRCGRPLAGVLAGLATAVALAMPAPAVMAAACGDMVLHAHRGSPDEPENSLSAVRGTLDGAWDGVEIDMQQLQTGEWVLNHDLTLGRTTSVARRTARELPASAWRELRLKDRNGRLTVERGAFLSDVVDETRKHPDKVLNAEIKLPFSGCDASLDADRAIAAGLPGGNWFLTAIDRRHLACARQIDPHGYMGLIVLDASVIARQKGVPETFAERIRPANLDAAWMKRLLQDVGAPVGIHIDAQTLKANPRVLAQARELGIPVLTYGLSGDRDHAEALRAVAAAVQMRPSGAIIDGTATGFCDAVNRH